MGGLSASATVRIHLVQNAFGSIMEHQDKTQTSDGRAQYIRICNYRQYHLGRVSDANGNSDSRTRAEGTKSQSIGDISEKVEDL